PTLVGRSIMLNCDSANDNVNVDNLGSTTRITYPAGVLSQSRDFANGAYDIMRCDLGNGANSLFLYSVPARKSISADGGTGINRFFLGLRYDQPSSTAGILSQVGITGTLGTNIITVNNSSDTTTRTLTLDESAPGQGRITGLTAQPILYLYGGISS